MQNITFIQDLAIVMIVAALVSILFHRFNQPQVIGYILAGIIIGPHTPPFSFIQDEASIQTLADLGLIFLMFSLGLEFNFRKLRQVGATAMITAVLDVVLMVWLGYMVGRWLGWGRIESIFLGAIICDSSTTLLAKTLSDLGWVRQKFAGLVFGITIVEDLLAIAIIALLNGLGTSGSVQAGAILGRMGELSAFLVAVVVLGLLAAPRLLGALARYKSDELLLITVLGLCFGVSLVAVKLQFSLALGAFLMGAVTAEARAIERIEQLVAPLRHTFSAVFFVTVGLLIQPALLIQHFGPIALITLLVIGAKAINCTAGALLTGNDPGTSLRVGLGMAQIGEFAYIIAAMGVALNMTDEFLYQIAVSVSLLTTVVNPYLLRGSGSLAGFLKKWSSPRIVETVQLYNNWLERIGEGRRNSAVLRVTRRSIWIVIINAALIAAIFLGGAFLAGQKSLWLSPFEFWEGAGNVLIWLICALAALPLYVSSLRKIQALGMIVSEMCVPPEIMSGWARNLRMLITHAVLLLGLLGLGVLTFVLSAALLPSWKELVVLLTLLALVMWMRWRGMIRVYARAQAALFDLFARETPRASAPAIQSLLSVHMETIVVTPKSQSVGKRIVDLQLRTLTGANAVSIERDSETIVNPGPAETIHPGDRILLLGNQEQIEKAIQLFR
ncbi:MAG TPA: cation/H(+) antiporter [Verrucomicrobia bacterium]|nr:cation/H(+) antiporter [Verrucomicrobiota bacterium]